MLRGNELIDEEIRKQIEERFLNKINRGSSNIRTLHEAFVRNPSTEASGAAQLHRSSKSPPPRTYGVPKLFNLNEAISDDKQNNKGKQKVMDAEEGSGIKRGRQEFESDDKKDEGPWSKRARTEESGRKDSSHSPSP